MTETSWFIVISTPFLNAASCVSSCAAPTRDCHTREGIFRPSPSGCRCRGFPFPSGCACGSCRIRRPAADSCHAPAPAPAAPFKLACLLLLGFLGLFVLGLLRGLGLGLLRGFFCLLGCGSGLCLFLRSRIAVCFLTHIYASGSLCLFSGPSIAGVWFFWNIRLRFSANSAGR